jgi:FkbM family methyltransferase
MSELKLNEQEIHKWFRDTGDYTHNINYDLSEKSVIMDLGGYTGLWAQQMVDKYNPHVYILEPVPVFYETMFAKFSNNKKVRLLNAGVGIEDTDGYIYMNGDGTSTNLVNGESIKVKFNTIETVLETFNLNEVDLIQINIEGDEYGLLENMLITGTVKKFKNIQVQFHLGVKNDVERRDKIREGLTNNGFELNFDYPFVWESWRLKK